MKAPPTQLGESLPEPKPTDPAAVKRMFLLLLDAKDPDATDHADRQATAAREMKDATPEVRAAAAALLDAHTRATGILLDDEPAHRTAPAGLPPPEIDGYRIIKEIGRGGFGIVYEAQQLHPVQRRVALKVLRADVASDATAARFRTEAAFLARLQHAGIASVFDAGFDTIGRAYLAVELIDGEPITAYCIRHNPTVPERVRLLAAVCDAVSHAHQRAVLHRDLKPANILVQVVDGEPMPKVIDFGIAKLVNQDPDQDQTATHETGRLGTPRYMSPEQLDPAYPADTRADVFALGIVLYEILAGDLPTDASGASVTTTKPSIASQQLACATAAPPSQLRGDLDRIVLKAIAADPSQRYFSVAAFADDLRRFLRSEPVSAGPPTARYRASKFVRRHTLGVSVVSAGALTVLFLLGVTAWQRTQALRSGREALRQAARAEFVVDFLLDDMLAAADPNTHGQTPVTVASVLDAADATARQRFASDPELLSDLLARIGRAQHFMARADRAAQNLTDALELAEQTGAKDEDKIRIRIDLAAALWTLPDRSRQALELQRSNVVDATALLGPTHPTTLRARMAAISDFPTPELAIQELDAIQAAWSITGDPGPIVRASALCSRASFVRQAYGSEQALESWKTAFEYADANIQPNHTVVINAQCEYGMILLDLNRNEEALEILLENQKRRDEVLPPDHPWRTAIAYSILRCMDKLGQYEQGLPIAREQVQLMTEMHGEGSLQQAAALAHLGTMYQGLGDLDAAADAFSQSLQTRTQFFGSEHLSVMVVRMRLALIQLDRGDPAAALDLSTQAMAVINKYPDYATRAALVHAKVLAASGRTPEALAAIDTVMSNETIQKQTSPVDAQTLATLRTELAAN